MSASKRDIKPNQKQWKLQTFSPKYKVVPARSARQVLETFSGGRQGYNYREITNKLHSNGGGARAPRDAARRFRETPSSDRGKLHWDHDRYPHRVSAIGKYGEMCMALNRTNDF